ncbi:adenosylhomocysteinase [Hordeum vulgare]|nr:adenosylhomocysteinase [Hordeum vulgare]
MALSVEKTSSGREYKVKDLSQADFGHLELELVEVEMPGLMACRTEFGPSQPFKGVRLSGSLHVTIQIAVLIETGAALVLLQHLLHPEQGSQQGNLHQSIDRLLCSAQRDDDGNNATGACLSTTAALRRGDHPLYHY